MINSGIARMGDNPFAILAQLRATNQNIAYAPGALTVDEYDPIIYDAVFRKYQVWNIIDKRPAVGDFTNGFEQTALGNARMVDKRTLTYSATSPTRGARTAREIKALTRDITFGLYDRSVYRQQGNNFGDLTAKDVADVYNSIMRLWSDKFYNGDSSGDPLDFDGLKKILGTGIPVASNVSIVKTLQEKVVTMMNSTSQAVMPTRILCNARVRQLISQEYRKAGDKMPTDADRALKLENVPVLDTAAGNLPLTVDNWNIVTAGTANVYPTFIVSEDKLSWQYVEPLDSVGPDPKVLQFALTNTVDEQHKGVMFGALELLGGTTHHAYLIVTDRSTVVDPTA